MGLDTINIVHISWQRCYKVVNLCMQRDELPNDLNLVNSHTHTHTHLCGMLASTPSVVCTQLGLLLAVLCSPHSVTSSIHSSDKKHSCVGSGNPNIDTSV